VVAVSLVDWKTKIPTQEKKENKKDSLQQDNFETGG
jgi:hypothetical protein